MNEVTTAMNHDPLVCTPETRISEIKHLLKKYDLEELLVIDQDKQPVGTVSWDDVNSPEIEEEDIPSDVSATEVMKAVAAVVHESSSLEECLNVMRLNHVDSLAVVNGNGQMEGVIDRETITKIIM